MMLKTFLIGLLLIQIPDAVRQTQMGTASGVVRLASGQPAIGVRVAAVVVPGTEAGITEGSLVSITQTDGNGRYRLENILPGRYYIQAGLLDAPTFYPGVTTTTGATSLLVAAGGTLDGLNFTMSQGSSGVRISGSVPMTGTRPILVALIGGASVRSTTTQIKPDGTFEFTKVAPGSYTLTASPSNGLPSLQITVADQDIEIGTAAGPGVKVSGTYGVGRRSPRPAGLKVILTGPSVWNRYDSTVASDGSFSMPSVPPGTYSLKAVPGTPSVLATVVVADREVGGIVVAAIDELAGKASLQDGSKFPPLSSAIMIQAKPAKGSAFATVISDGAFRFPLPEGEYRITLGKLPAGASVKSLIYGSVDLLKSPLVLDGSSELSELRVVLEMPAAR